jgi:Tripartite tricarboxylate transporter family receptor
MLLPAPGRFSTKNCWPTRSESQLPISLARRVREATGRKARNDAHWTRGIVERRCDSRQGRKNRSAHCQTQKFATGGLHDIPPHYRARLLQYKKHLNNVDSFQSWSPAEDTVAAFDFTEVGIAYNASLYDNLNFNFIRDIAPVASIGRVAFVMVVNPSFAAKTVPEFIANAKANPGKINMATVGPGSPSQLFGVLFKSMAGVDLVTVNYRGIGPALLDLISGRVEVIFTSIASTIDYIRSGKLRLMYCPTCRRSANLSRVTSRPVGWGSVPVRTRRRRL